jgi:hypothetical protein
MKGDPVAFTVEHDCAKAMRPDCMHVLKHLPIVGRDRLYGFGKTSCSVEIDKRAYFRGALSSPGEYKQPSTPLLVGAADRTRIQALPLC